MINTVKTVSKLITVPLARKFKDNIIYQTDDGTVVMKLSIASNSAICQVKISLVENGFKVDYDSLIKIPPEKSRFPCKCSDFTQVVKSIFEIQTLVEEETVRQALRISIR